jgi:corrinoid protein of di/trimethylamine methyltransferase
MEAFMSKELFEALAQSIIDGEDEDAAGLAQQVIDQNIDPLEAINQGYVAGLDEVGEQYSRGEMFLPDLVLAAEAMKAAMAVLEPELARRGAARSVLGKVVIGTVDGDIHDIGKTLVATMLSANGFKVYDMGVNVPIQKFIDKINEVDANLVGLSALLTTTMVKQRAMIETLQEAGLRDKVQVIVGGAPVTRSWAEEIGADGYSEDAIGAVAVARQLMGA